MFTIKYTVYEQRINTDNEPNLIHIYTHAKQTELCPYRTQRQRTERLCTSLLGVVELFVLHKSTTVDTPVT